MLISVTPGLSLAFANTRYWRGSAQPTDELPDAAALARWLTNNAGLDTRVARELERDQALFIAAVALRETLYRTFSALASHGTPPGRDVADLQAALRAAPTRDRLALSKDGFAWQVEPRATDAASLLAPVLWSAADLLTGEAVQRLRRCGNEKCLYLFVDNSRAGARRWCDMKACGNRAKAHRHYLKSKILEHTIEEHD